MTEYVDDKKTKFFRLIIRIVQVVVSIIIAFILIFMLYLCTHITNSKLTVSFYSVNDNLQSSIRIVQLTDLHNAEFGDNNSELVSLVKKQAPDLIVMTGDMINRDDPDLTVICNLISDLSTISPVYYGYGNHEHTWIENYGDTLYQSLTDAGAIVVDNDYLDVTINGENLRIGGYMGYYRQPGMFSVTDEDRQEQLDFAADFENTDCYKILLNHIPTAWLDWEYIDNYPVDLVFSGHYHGGQWVLPIIGAVYAPYVGFNPPYTKGVFEGTEATCVLSAGLGNERTWLPRVNNPPELVIVDLVSEN